jgi:hypothetical protein
LRANHAVAQRAQDQENLEHRLILHDYAQGVAICEQDFEGLVLDLRRLFGTFVRILRRLRLLRFLLFFFLFGGLLHSVTGCFKACFQAFFHLSFRLTFDIERLLAPGQEVCCIDLRDGLVLELLTQEPNLDSVP